MINSKISEKGSLVKMIEHVLGTAYKPDSNGSAYYDLSIVELQPGQILLLLEESENESIVLVPNCGEVHFPTYVDILPMDVAEAKIYPVYEHVQK